MKLRLFVACVCAIAATYALAADTPPQVDWSKVPGRTVTLFYPGQSSYEWLRRTHMGDSKAMTAAQRGVACMKCHEGDEKAMGAKFDLKGFHDQVLEDGAVPLAYLRDKIRMWSAPTR